MANVFLRTSVRLLLICSVVIIVLLFALQFVLVSSTSAAPRAASNPIDHRQQVNPAVDCAICRAKAEWWEWAETITNAARPGQQPGSQPIRAASDPSEIIYWMRMVYQNPVGTLNSNSQIYYHNFAGSTDIIALTSQGSNTQPRLAPDLRRIVFVSNRDKRDNGNGNNREIYLINNDGTGETRLTTHSAIDTMPAWSPDGQQIVFASERDGKAELYVMRADGSNLRRLTNNGVPDLYPTWSPDGRTIAWVQVNGESGDLMLMNADGSNPRPRQTGLRFLARPAWSPNGDRLAFDYDGNGDGFNEPYLLELAGGAPQLIPTQDLGLDEWWIGAWEPAARSILMTNLHFVGSGSNVAVDYIQAVTVCFDPTALCDDVAPNATYSNSPDIRSADPIPPTAGLRTIAPFTRVADDLVELRVADQGGSGIKEIHMEYRTPLTATLPWAIVGRYRGSRLFTPLPNAGNLPLGQYEYRIRAEDFAGNRSPWSAFGTSFIYMKTAAGQVMDNRGVGLVNIGVPISPDPLMSAVSDNQGKYMAYLSDVNVVKINDQLQRDDGDLDYRYDFYLKPTTNLVTYGDFEILALQGAWTVSGTLMPTLQSEIVNAGQNAIRLGGLCTGLCLQRAANSPLFGEVNTVAIDGQGVVHLVALVNETELTYWQRNAAGIWSEPELIYSGSAVSAVTSAANQQGDFITAWETPRNYNAPLYLRKRTADGQWSVGRQVAGGRQPRIFMDAQGIWHLFYEACADAGVCSQWTIAHTHQLADGNPSAFVFPVTADEQLVNIDAVALAVTPAGSAHLIYSRAGLYGYGVTVLEKTFDTVTQSWSAGQEIPTRTDSFCEYLFIDRHDTFHLLCSGGWYISYLQRPVGGRWSEPSAALFSAFGYDGYRATMDRNDMIHLVQYVSNIGGTVPLPYFYKPLAGAWSRRQPVTDLDADPPWSSVGVNHMVAGPTLAAIGGAFWGYSFRESLRATATALSSIAKVLTIPADLSQPTLSFMYALYGSTPTSTSHFDVTVSDGLTPTVLFSATTNTDWQLGWADLTPWQGKTITLTLATHQAADELYLQAYVDEVALGTWATPVVQSMEPIQVPAGQPMPVTLRGINLRNGLQLWLGRHAVSGLAVDEATATVTFDLPANLAPGTYPLYLAAAGSSQRSYGGTIFIGTPLWLPVITR